MVEEPNFSGQMSAMEATVYQTFKVNMLSSLVIKAPIQLGEFGWWLWQGVAAEKSVGVEFFMLGLDECGPFTARCMFSYSPNFYSLIVWSELNL